MQSEKPNQNKSLANSIAKVLSGLLCLFFGEFHWSAPKWLQWLAQLPIRVNKYRQLNAQHFYRCLVLVLTLGLTISGTYYYLATRPKPKYVSVSTVVPQPMPLVKDALPEPLVVRFSESVAPLELVGKEVTTGVTLKPHMAGAWQWRTDSELVFQLTAQPLTVENIAQANYWPAAQDFEIKLDRKALPSHVKLERYSYEFQTPQFAGTIKEAKFYQDPANPSIKKVIATLGFSHQVDKVNLQKRIRVRYNPRADRKKGHDSETKEISFSLAFDPYSSEAYLETESMTSGRHEAEVAIELEKNLEPVRGPAKTTTAANSSVIVPSLYNYLKVESISGSYVKNEHYQTERVVHVETNLEISQEELKRHFNLALLPIDRPAFQGKPASENHYWYSTSEIGPEVLQFSENLPLQWIPTEREYSNIHSFRYSAPVGRYLYLEVTSGLTSFGGFILAKNSDNIVRVDELPKEISIMHEGALLSLSGKKIISLVTRDVEDIQFEVSRIEPNSVHHMLAATSGNFKDPYFFNYGFNQDNLSERFTEVRSLPKTEPGKVQYTTYDFSMLLNSEQERPRGLFLFKAQNWNRKNKRPDGVSDQRLILVTDLGVLVKLSSTKEHDLYVQRINSGEPAEDVQVSILGKNGLPLLTKRTSSEGHVHFPRLKGFKREKSPIAYVVQSDSDYSFLPYQRRDRELNISRFDVGGLTTSADPGTLTANLFSSRGLYRPGDKLELAAIVKPEDWSVPIAGIPLEMELQDARGLAIRKWKYRLTAEGFSDFDYQLLETSPTGAYHAQLYLVKNGWRDRLLGSTTLRVEEFLPDQLKIRGSFSKTKGEGWVSPEELGFSVTLENLFGTPAEGNKVTLNMSLTPARVSFRRYQDYAFTDPSLGEKSYREQIGEIKTDLDGRAAFQLPLEKFDAASYHLSVYAEGFEDGSGRSVAVSDTILVSPQQALVGVKADGKLSFVARNSARNIQFIAVDPELNQIDLSNLELHLLRHKTLSVLKKQPNNTYAYQSVASEELVSTADFAIVANGSSVELPTKEPGTFSYVLKNKASTVLSKITFTVVGDANLTKNLEKNAELELTLSKEDYATGEEVKMQITAPYPGAGLITIERDKVYAHKWFSSITTSTSQSIILPPGVEGNAYINVSFVRALDSAAIYQSPLSYAVKPFSISREKRSNKIELIVPELVRPGEQMAINYRAQRRAKAIIFAVDEGILLAASYRNPDPLATFFQKRALQVNTRQILDLILPEYLADKLSSAPGGGDGALLGKNLNPFKRKRHLPVVYWSGVIDIGPDAQTISYSVPDYFSGAIRVLAVAVSEADIGTSVAQTTVRGDFVISPHLPTFVTPGDEFFLSATITNAAKDSGAEAKLKMTVETSSHLQIIEGQNSQLDIAEGREGNIRLKLKVLPELGAAEVRFAVSLLGNDKISARLAESISVRPAAPYRTSLSAGNFSSGSEDVAVTRKMFPAFRELKASLSTVPLSLAHGLQAYLSAYPYACTEQLVSQAFSTIILERRPEFDIRKQRASSEFFKIQNILRARQNASGAFGFWAANSHISEFQAVYATHFLTDAKEFGYPVQEDLLQNALSFLKLIAAGDKGVPVNEQIRAYAIYVLTRNSVVTSNYIDSLRKDLAQTGNQAWQVELTASYLAAAYKIMRSNSEADKLIRLGEINAEVVSDYSRYYDKLLHSSQRLYLLAKHFPELLPDVTAEDIVKMIKPITWGLYNTISSASTVLALDAYATAVGNPQASSASISEIAADGSEKPVNTTGALIISGYFNEAASKLRFSGQTENHLFYQVAETGYDTSLPLEAKKDGLEITRHYLTASGQPVESAKLGERIRVQVLVRAIGEHPLPDIAVIDLLPSGFEVDTKRGSGANRSSLSSTSYTWAPQYVDIREDRILLFGQVDKNVREFVYELVPVAEGRFTVPPIYAESMYDRSVQGLSLGGTISVVGTE